MAKQYSSKSWEKHNYYTVFKLIFGLLIFIICVYLLIFNKLQLLIMKIIVFPFVIGLLIFTTIYTYNAMRELEICDVRSIENMDMLKIKKGLELSLLKNNYSFKINTQEDIFQNTTIDYRLTNLETGLQLIYTKKKNSGLIQIIRININEDDIKTQLKNMIIEVIDNYKS